MADDSTLLRQLETIYKAWPGEAVAAAVLTLAFVVAREHALDRAAAEDRAASMAELVATLAEAAARLAR